MAKIFVTNYNPQFSYEVAYEYGDPVFMTQAFVPPEGYAHAQKKFDTFAASATADDVLLLSGANVLVAMAVAAWLRYFPSVTILQHGKTRNSEGKIVDCYTLYTLER
jgi:hypothetical protein